MTHWAGHDYDREAYYTLSQHRDALPMTRPDGVSERNWAIMLASFRDKRTMVDIAHEHHLSAPRVRQILMRVAGRCLGEEGD